MILSILPLTTFAVAAAPMPSPTIVTTGVPVYPNPGFATVIEEIPVND